MELRRRETGEKIDLVDGMVFGRLDSCAVKVDDGSISRRHAEVKQTGRAFELLDLGSSNGIFQNGKRKQRFLIRPGDLVTLGAVAFDVIDQAPAAAPTASTASPAPAVSESERARARLRREMTGDGRSSGLGDLSQQPLGIQLLILAVGLGVMYGVVVGIRYLAGSL
ncbi:MAG: FHA domain-containing protein [Planctomycetota bacterium]|nr:FHA domain-containing protein [Planctomycetota bacterium]MDA1113994.1 FHA domain-containing protein [Planctomycetota bacterium]